MVQNALEQQKGVLMINKTQSQGPHEAALSCHAEQLPELP